MCLKVVTIMVLVFLAALPVSARVNTAGSNINGSIRAAGRIRRYILHLPGGAGSKAQAKMPLLIVLHGGMENGSVIRKISRMDEFSDRYGFLVLYPDGTGRLKRKLLSWNAFDCCGLAMKKNVDDVSFISQLIDRISETYDIDQDRVYVCGYSNGAMLAFRLASELSNRIAAIASIGGSMSGKEKMPEQPVSVLMIHGSDDRHVPYDGGGGKWEKWGFPVNKKAVAYALDFWRKADSCSSEAAVEENDRIKVELFKGGRQGTLVKLVTLKNARHTWPGGRQSLLYTDKAFAGFDASQECWNFFRDHPRRQSDFSEESLPAASSQN